MPDIIFDLILLAIMYILGAAFMGWFGYIGVTMTLAHGDGIGVVDGGDVIGISILAAIGYGLCVILGHLYENSWCRWRRERIRDRYAEEEARTA